MCRITARLLAVEPEDVLCSLVMTRGCDVVRLPTSNAGLNAPRTASPNREADAVWFRRILHLSEQEPTAWITSPHTPPNSSHVVHTCWVSRLAKTRPGLFTVPKALASKKKSNPESAKPKPHARKCCMASVSETRRLKHCVTALPAVATYPRARASWR